MLRRLLRRHRLARRLLRARAVATRLDGLRLLAFTKVKYEDTLR